MGKNAGLGDVQKVETHDYVPLGWTTTVAYVDGSLAHPDRDLGMSSITAEVRPEGTTIVDRADRSISCITALPVLYGEETADRSYCPPKMARDALSPDELDMVCGYMSNPMHLGIPSKGSSAQSWWEDSALLTGYFMRNEFVASMVEHWAHQDKLAGSNPPTWGDLYRPTQPHHQPQPAADGRQKF